MTRDELKDVPEGTLVSVKHPESVNQRDTAVRMVDPGNPDKGLGWYFTSMNVFVSDKRKQTYYDEMVFEVIYTPGGTA